MSSISLLLLGLVCLLQGRMKKRRKDWFRLGWTIVHFDLLRSKHSVRPPPRRELETDWDGIGRAVRTSSLKNISLRHNKISASGGVALALMIRDYPDIVPASYSSLTSPTSPSSPYSSYSSLSGFGPVPMSPTSSFSSITSSTTSSAASSPRMGSADLTSPPGTPRMGGKSSFLPGQTTTQTPSSNQTTSSTPTQATTRMTAAPTTVGGKGGALPPPPPRHPTALGVQTTYTPYVPRSRRGAAGAAGAGSSGGSIGGGGGGSGRSTPTTNGGGMVPLMTTSAQGGVTTRHVHTHTHTQSQSQTAAHLQSLALAHGHGQGQGQAGQGQGHVSSASLGGGGGKRDLGPSAALLDKVRALDSLPRIGSLRTLDLKGNDLRVRSPPYHYIILVY